MAMLTMVIATNRIRLGIHAQAEVFSEHHQASEMEVFLKVVNGLLSS